VSTVLPEPPRNDVDGVVVDRREQILQAAAALFYEHGYRATRLSDVADALNIKAPSLYYHFQNKQDLLATLMSRTMDDLIDAGRDAINSAVDPVAQFSHMVHTYVVLVGSRASEGMVGDRELRHLEPENRALIVAKRDQYQRMIQDVLSAGKAAQVFEFADTKFTAFSVLGMCNHIGIWYQPSGRLSLDEIAELSVDAALRIAGCRPRETPTNGSPSRR
jgi:AcrR family transcriptional regulator